MNTTDYAYIAPLVSSAVQEGNQMQVSFRCPVQGSVVSASGMLQKDDGVGSRVADGMKRRLGWGVKSALAGSVRRAMGYGIAGSMASGAVYGAASGASKSQSFSDAEKQAAIARAFQGVQSGFAWDAPNQRYISAEAAGATQLELSLQLEKAPILVPYDRNIFARIMAQVAASDGSLGTEERNFFAYFVTPDMGTIDSIVQMPPPSSAELSELSQGAVRETMLMLAWALALSDQELDAGEEAALQSFASGLGTTPERSSELKLYAQSYQVDLRLSEVYRQGNRDPAAFAQVQEFGRSIGMSDAEVEKVDIRYRKRFGLV